VYYWNLEPEKKRRKNPKHRKKKTMSAPSNAPAGGEVKKEEKKEEKGDFSTAILDRKKAPNRLLVDEATADDNSVISLHPGNQIHTLTHTHTYRNLSFESSSFAVS
jgi:outer membrane biosynthesis protein TonB